MPLSDFANAVFKVYAETSLGDVPIFEKDVCDVQTCQGRGGQRSQLTSVMRISNALAGQDSVMVVQIQSSELMLCVRVPFFVT